MDAPRRRARREAGPEGLIRKAWERKWGQPSTGNPLFEDVPLMLHLEALFEPPATTPEDEAAMNRAQALVEAGFDPFEDDDRA